jgi:hypothetical protein
MVRQLPIVKIESKHYFVDERLKEYREISNPHNRIRFEDLGERKPVSVELKQNHKQGNKRRIQ